MCDRSASDQDVNMQPSACTPAAHTHPATGAYSICCKLESLWKAYRRYVIVGEALSSAFPPCSMFQFKLCHGYVRFKVRGSVTLQANTRWTCGCLMATQGHNRILKRQQMKIRKETLNWQNQLNGRKWMFTGTNYMAINILTVLFPALYFQALPEEEHISVSVQCMFFFCPIS